MQGGGGGAALDYASAKCRRSIESSLGVINNSRRKPDLLFFFSLPLSLSLTLLLFLLLFLFLLLLLRVLLLLLLRGLRTIVFSGSAPCDDGSLNHYLLYFSLFAKDKFQFRF